MCERSAGLFKHCDLHFLDCVASLTSHNFQWVQSDLRRGMVSCPLHGGVQHPIHDGYLRVIEDQPWREECGREAGMGLLPSQP